MSSRRKGSALPRWASAVRKEVLSNGLTLLVQPNASAPVAAVVTRVRAGFFDEPDRWTGISHVLEHMFFKGTPRRGVGEIARETKRAGGYLNASTSYDHTSYITVLPASNLATGLAVQSDALRHASLDADELARELRVIVEEAKRKLDTASAVAHETLHEVMFDRHRIRRWRIGREEGLLQLTRDDLQAYYRSRYVPERTIVAISGAFDTEKALDMARMVYEDWPAVRGAVDPSPDEPLRREVRARTLRGDLTRAELTVGWRTVPPLHRDAVALDMAAAVLGAGRGSWLYRGLRESGLVTSVAAYNYTPTELGIFSMAATLAPEQVPAALAALAESVARLVDAGPSAEDLARCRTLLTGRWARQMESMEGRASALASAEMLQDFSLLDTEYNALMAVTPDDVRQVAAHYLRPDSVSAVAYLPADAGADLTAATLSHAFSVSASTPLAPVQAPALPTARPGRAVPREKSREGGVFHTELPGVDLLIKLKSGTPLATIGMYVPRPRFDPPPLAGLGALTMRSAVRGAGDFDAAGIAFAFEQLGGMLSPSTAADWLGFGTTVLAEHVDAAAALLDLVFTHPRLEADSIERERHLMALEAAQVADDMFRYPLQLALRAAFGDRGHGLPVGGLPDTLASIGADDVRQYHTQTFLGIRPVVVFVGNLELHEAADRLAAVFGEYPVRSASTVEEPSPWLVSNDLVTKAVDRDKAQSAFAMLFPGPDRRDRLRGAAEVWAAVASGLGGRLFEALRERRSLAYTVFASAWAKRRAGALVTYIATSPERELEARDAMLEELARFRDEPVSDAELQQAVNYLVGQTAVGRQSGAALAAEILEAWMTGTGFAEIGDPAAVYRGVTAVDIREVVAMALEAGSRAEGLIRGKDQPASARPTAPAGA